MGPIPQKIVDECKRRLLEKKEEILNRVTQARSDLAQLETGGDEADQTVRQLAESELLIIQDRLRYNLMEIESALSRIANGTYGICEETEELIETARLLAVPWTRLSIEGAEMREAMGKRFAHK